MSVGAGAVRRARLGRLPLRMARPRLRLPLALALVLAFVLGAGWLLIRDSSLVSVDHVTVTGQTGPDAAAIRTALERAARKMTTLDIQMGQLREAVSEFPEVKGLQVSTQLPHGLAIHVIEAVPVATVAMAGREVPVTGDGTILSRDPVTGGLPEIAFARPAPGRRLHGRWVLGAAALLAAAPYRLLARLSEVTVAASHGLVAQIRSGPSIYFGDPARLAAKWIAVLAVLADPGSAGASYIDVTDPARPVAGSGDAAGAASPAPSSAGAASVPTASPASSTGAASAGATPGVGAATAGAAAPGPAGAGSTGTDGGG